MSFRRTFVWWIPILVAVDLLAINGGFLLAYWVRFHSGAIPVTLGIPSLQAYLRIFFLVDGVLVWSLRSNGLYAMGRRSISLIDEVFQIAQAMAVGFLFLLAMTFFYRDASYSRAVLLLSCFFSTALLMAGRLTAEKLRRRILVEKRLGRRVLIVGADDRGRKIQELAFKNPEWGYEVVGFVKADHEAAHTARPVVGKVSDFTQVLEAVKPDEVILTSPALERDQVVKLILECEKQMVSFQMVPDLLGMVTAQVDVRPLGSLALVGLKESPLSDPTNRFFKRVIDVAGSGLGLLVLAPVLALTAFLIKRDSPGPVFYLQERMGQNGRIFKMVKFRTMQVGAEGKTGPVWAKADDPRRTRLGIFLRRYNVDELPQLFNVFAGDMSLVGPRPERPHFVGRFKEDIPRYMARHRIKSGITGWAQVHGLRGNTSIEERTQYDLYYVENWSLLLDLKILFMSLRATKNAY